MTHPAFLLLAILLLLPVSPSARAQTAPLSDEVHVGTSEGVNRIALAVPVFLGDYDAATLLRETVQADLAFSGLFELVTSNDEAAYRLKVSIEKPNADEHVVVASLRQGRDGVVLFGKRWSGSERSLRRIAHKMADHIVEVFTGSKGAFDSRIAYVSDRGDVRDIHVIDYDGANDQQVTRDGALVLSPDVSSDGRYLFFTSYVEGPPAVFRVSRSSGAVNRLLQKDGLNQSPAVSPDGQDLAISGAFEGNSEIYITSLDGKTLRRLTNSAGIDVSPAWSPTGRQIAFQSDRAGTPQIYLMNSDGLDLRRLTYDGAYNGEPTFSPDGASLAFSSRRAGKFQIAILDLASGAVQLVTRGGFNHESPSWSPDGEFLAFASDRGGKYDIWIVRRDGTGLRRVGGRGANRHPCWYR